MRMLYSKFIDIFWISLISGSTTASISAIPGEAEEILNVALPFLSVIAEVLVIFPKLLERETVLSLIGLSD